MRCSASYSSSIGYTRLMCFRKVIRGLFCGLLRFFRTLSRLILSQRRLRYTRQINMESDSEYEFDSTWEDKNENKTPRKKVLHRRSRRNMYAAKDMQDFRHSCRGLDGDISDDDDDDDDRGEQDKGRFYNLEFYHGRIKSSPDNVHIDEFHQEWLGEYEKLEDVHSYIQWLFPIQEPGVNWRAHVLTKKEIKLFCKDKQAKRKLVKSYKLMLDFYGIRLVSELTGEVARAPNWKDRFRNLNRYSHNNLRITRILKCLGTLGLKHYQAPLVKFFLHETLVVGNLSNVKQSALDYFMFAVLDKSERQELVKFAFEHFKPREYFVWGPKKILSGQMTHYKKENVDQPTENKQSSTAEDQQNRVNSNESKHEMNKTDASHPPEEMESKKDDQNKDELLLPNKMTETNSDQGANKNSHCSSENESVANKSHGHDVVSVSHHNKEKPSCQLSDIEMKDATEDEESEDKKRVNSNESNHEMTKTDASRPPEEMESKKDDQNEDEPVFPNKMTETNSDQGANKNSHCSSENESVANKSHGHDAVSVSHHNKEKPSCQLSDIEMKDATEDEESEDKKRVNSNESNHEMTKTDASHPPEEMESKKDDQNEDEPVNPNHSTETNSGHDAVSGSHQNTEKSSCEVPNIDMRDTTEDEEEETKL